METDTNPSWSPDGTRIAYNYFTPTASGIAVVPASGGTPTIISSNPGYGQTGYGTLDSQAFWSPDSSSLAFWSENAFHPGSRIWVAAADGSGARLLTQAGRYSDFQPSWSPDGRKIVFSRSSASSLGERIWLMSADGSGKRRLMAENRIHSTGDTEPAWSPDGKLIAFVRGGHVYTVQSDGSHERRLAAGDGPQWSSNGRQLAFLRWYRNFLKPTETWIETVRPSPGPPQRL